MLWEERRLPNKSIRTANAVTALVSLDDALDEQLNSFEYDEKHTGFGWTVVYKCAAHLHNEYRAQHGFIERKTVDSNWVVGIDGFYWGVSFDDPRVRRNT